MLHLFKKKAEVQAAETKPAPDDNDIKKSAEIAAASDFIVGIKKSTVEKVTNYFTETKKSMFKGKRNYNVTVADQYRTHPWSTEPGGVTLIVEYHDGNIRKYDKVKNVEAYSRKIRTNPEVKSITVQQ